MSDGAKLGNSYCNSVNLTHSHSNGFLVNCQAAFPMYTEKYTAGCVLINDVIG